MKKKNVVGVMVGHEKKGGNKTGRDAVVVLVEKKEDLANLTEQDIIPRQYVDNGDEVATDVIETGVIKALHKSKHRPVVPGTSIGHFAITAGTLGVVVDKAGEQYILSNNHVLANENNAQAGDTIIQPGPYDGGRNPEDKVAELADFVPIDFSGTNLVDAALAKFVGGDQPEPDPEPEPDPTPPPPPDIPDEDSDCPVANLLAKIINLPAKLLGRSTRLKAVRPTSVEVQATEGNEFINEPLNLGPITKALGNVFVGDTVKKSGRTTGVTIDEVLGVDAAANVQYDAGVAYFEDQIICGPMSAGGDSGSVVYDQYGNAIGLLFAGSDTVTIVNRIQDVFSALDIDKIS
ncbi:MAG: chymotrypsin family serine protease [Planctomycetota bacterium]